MIFLLDEDECDTNACGTNAYCINVVGGFDCKCNEGYAGDGYQCVPIGKSKVVIVHSILGCLETSSLQSRREKGVRCACRFRNTRQDRMGKACIRLLCSRLMMLIQFSETTISNKIRNTKWPLRKMHKGFLNLVSNHTNNY